MVDGLNHWKAALAVFEKEIELQRTVGEISPDDANVYRRGAGAAFGWLAGLGFKITPPEGWVSWKSIEPEMKTLLGKMAQKQGRTNGVRNDDSVT